MNDLDEIIEKLVAGGWQRQPPAFYVNVAQLAQRSGYSFEAVHEAAQQALGLVRDVSNWSALPDSVSRLDAFERAGGTRPLTGGARAEMWRRRLTPRAAQTLEATSTASEPPWASTGWTLRV